VLPGKSAKIYGLGRGHGSLRVGNIGPLTLKGQSILRQTCLASTWPISASSWTLASRARGGEVENVVSELARRRYSWWI
jgi:hypothetical protein